MQAVSELRQCHLCGRKGTRRFYSPDGGLGWRCTAERACNKRRAAFLRPFKRWAA